MTEKEDAVSGARAARADIPDISRSGKKNPKRDERKKNKDNRPDNGGEQKVREPFKKIIRSFFDANEVFQKPRLFNQGERHFAGDHFMERREFQNGNAKGDCGKKRLHHDFIFFHLARQNRGIRAHVAHDVRKMFFCKRKKRNPREGQMGRLAVRYKSHGFLSDLRMVEQKVREFYHFPIDSQKEHVCRSGADDQKIEEETPGKNSQCRKRGDAEQIPARLNREWKEIKKDNRNDYIHRHHEKQAKEKDLSVFHEPEFVEPGGAEGKEPKGKDNAERDKVFFK